MAQLEATHDILPDGKILAGPGTHLDQRQRFVRREIVDAIAHIQAKEAGKTKVQGIDDYTREAAFTSLNRFVALKMLEARGLVQQCVSKGDQSSGFKEFSGLAPGLADLPDKGYQLYLECLFDELGTEVKVLFDRRDSASLLWPRRQSLLDLIAILNRSELEGVWDQDETIGWVYQYFNGQEERRQCATPRPRRATAVSWPSGTSFSHPVTSSSSSPTTRWGGSGTRFSGGRRRLRTNAATSSVDLRKCSSPRAKNRQKLQMVSTRCRRQICWIGPTTFRFAPRKTPAISRSSTRLVVRGISCSTRSIS